MGRPNQDPDKKVTKSMQDSYQKRWKNLHLGKKKKNIDGGVNKKLRYWEKNQTEILEIKNQYIPEAQQNASAAGRPSRRTNVRNWR